MEGEDIYKNDNDQTVSGNIITDIIVEYHDSPTTNISTSKVYFILKNGISMIHIENNIQLKKKTTTTTNHYWFVWNFSEWYDI